MEEWQQRVISEKAQVDLKLVALTGFLNDEEKVADIDPEQFALMVDQKDAMTEYSRILGERIARFGS